MERPADYPLSEKSSDDNSASTSQITYAELQDRVQTEQPVTDDMIRTAVDKINNAHAHSETTENGSGLGITLSRLRNKLWQTPR